MGSHDLDVIEDDFCGKKKIYLKTGPFSTNCHFLFRNADQLLRISTRILANIFQWFVLSSYAPFSSLLIKSMNHLINMTMKFLWNNNGIIWDSWHININGEVNKLVEMSTDKSGEIPLSLCAFQMMVWGKIILGSIFVLRYIVIWRGYDGFVWEAF